MIDSQLRPSGVNAPFVLDRMGEVAREDFVPPDLAAFAYMDRALRLGDGRHLPAPLVHGLMLQEAAPHGGEHALVVDCGAGYLPELLRPLVASVAVLSASEALLPGAGGPKAQVLLVEGAVEHLPQPLLDRLAEGGRIVTGLVDNGVTRLAIGRKGEHGAALLPVADIGIPEMIALRRPRGWSF